MSNINKISPIWSNFASKHQSKLSNAITSFSLISPAILIFILDLAIRIESVLSRRHFDWEKWVMYRTNSDAFIIVEKTEQRIMTVSAAADLSIASSKELAAAFLSKASTVGAETVPHNGVPLYLSSSLLSPSLSAIKDNSQLYHHQLLQRLTSSSSSIIFNRINLPILMQQSPMAIYLKKFQIGIILASALVGLININNPINDSFDINGFRKLCGSFSFSDWLFGSPRGVRNEKLKCIFSYFSILRDLCLGNYAEFITHPKMQNIVIIERRVGVKVFNTSANGNFQFNFSDQQIIEKYKKSLEQTTAEASEAEFTAGASNSISSLQSSEFKYRLTFILQKLFLSKLPLASVEIDESKSITDCDGCLQVRNTFFAVDWKR